MPFQKGNSGRPEGAINKTSKKVREAVVKFLENNIQTVQKDFTSLKTPNARLKFITELLPYAAPKLSSIQTETDSHISGGITIVWEEPKNYIANSNGNGKEVHAGQG